MTHPMTRCILHCSAAILFAGVAVGQVPGSPGEKPAIPEDTEIQTTDSGLKYSVLKAVESDAESPAMGDQVEVHYTGWLTDGSVFDSSRQRGVPAKFVLGQVIDGWNEGLQLMNPGERYKFTIPYELAYGAEGRPPTIPAEATLIFDIELISFDKGPRFRKPNADAQKSTDDGLKYEVLVEGAGDPPDGNTTVVMNYSFWTDDGRLLQTSVFQPRTPRGMPGQYGVEILRKGLQLMKPGSTVLFEVPPALAFGDQDQPGLPAGSTTIWQLELLEVVRPMAVPDFAMPASDKLVETQSGLKYEVIVEGSGDSPRMGQMVRVHYAGWLTDGTPFDSSYGRGEPSEFRLGAVIRGWNEGLQLMAPGAVYKFVIPAKLGYGERGSPPKIGPNATLVFQVELISFK